MSPLARMQAAKRQLSSRELRTSCFDYPLAFLPAHTSHPARRFSEEEGIGRDVRRKARRRGDDEAEAPDKREVMRSMRRKRKMTPGMRKERRREAKEDSSGTGDDGGQKTSKTEAREPDSSSAFALPCPTRLALYSPRPCLCLASPRLACACQLATRRQTRPSLSFVLMPTRLHASVFLVVVFLFTLANLNPGPSRHAAASSLAALRSRLSLPRSRKREPFRSPAALLSSPRHASSERACKRNGKAI
ncbi:hypothetical protein ALC57_16015 [Trachymyrmex cornetzi]|uniref:Uncharacterized protein n=1 Tax=Trachymyrmex cornetzi TaxID=471704 RepID=A0A195DHD9_9HYME|nr:hypothetical protein ALC57_16015 [Trachymyrmex cornetzi]